MKIIDGEKLRNSIIDELCDKLQCDDCPFYDDATCMVGRFIDRAPQIEVIAEPPKRSDGIVSEHSNGTVSMTKQTWMDTTQTMENYRKEIEDWTIQSWEHDGCMDCKYEHRKSDDLPCVTCRQNYKDCWTAKEDCKEWIDRDKLVQRLCGIMGEDKNKDMQAGIMQAILVATLMDTAETVERGDVPYDETDCI